jgi:RimJ/RimL family protein N-acetyltransferase
MRNVPELTIAVDQSSTSDAGRAHWTERLPVLTGQHVTLRELRADDAASLLAMLSTEKVSRFISPPPSTVQGFERFIAWALRQRAAGTCACYAVTVTGFDIAIGLFQVRQTELGFATAEWGFALGRPFWGTGIYAEAAALVLDFAFDTLGAHRVEARAAILNGRGNSALLKIGAVREGMLRRSMLLDGGYVDQALYAVVDDDWRARRAQTPSPPLNHIH